MRRFFILSVATIFLVAAISSPSVVAALLLSSSSEDALHQQNNQDNNNSGEDHSVMTSLYANETSALLWNTATDNSRNRGRRKTRRRRQLSSTFYCPTEMKKAPPSPQLPTIPLLKQSFYAASFPGSNDKLISKSLVQSMTGLYVGDASTSPSLKKMEALSLDRRDNNGGSGGSDNNNVVYYGQGEVLALRTHFPHTSGKLASWDADISRAFIILRNPMYAIPQYFNQIYINNNHLNTNSGGGSEQQHHEHQHEQVLFTGEHKKASHDAWIKWRDNQLHSQILLYRRFVSFWMEKFLGNDGNRIYLSYEELVGGGGQEDSNRLPEEAIRLATFLNDGIQLNIREMAAMVAMNSDGNGSDGGGGGEGSTKYLDLFGGSVTDESIEKATSEMMKHVTPLEDVPCLWKHIVHPTTSSSSSSGTTTSLNDNDMWTWNQEERPYTPENLMAISQMLLELINRWSRHQRLLNILSKYHREVNRAYLEATGALKDQDYDSDNGDEGEEIKENRVKEQQEENVVVESNPVAQSQQSPPQIMMDKTKSFHIFQASPPDTGSIFLTNWLMGIFEPNANIALMEVPELPVIQNGQGVNVASTIVTKSTYLDLLHLYKQYRPLFDEVFFVVSNRGEWSFSGGTRIDPKLCEYKNVLCIESEELIYHNRDELLEVIRSLTNKFRNRFRYFFGIGSEWLSFEREENALLRLEEMSKVAATMATESSDVMDNKFGVYGRNNGTQRQRRRLSIALPDGGCEITWPQPPKKPYETAYAASYPGCGARMTWNLVEALTGLWTGDDWDSNNRGKRVVTVKTHYPHDAGRLVPWDDEINRAMVIIRNPMNAIPSFFNHIYEMKNHLPVHSQRAPVDAWIEWRDRLAAIQIDRFEKFVDYWMERFVYLNDNRIFVSYERLTDDEMGPEEAIRMTKFLGQSEGVTPIEIESVPCVWKSVVKYKESLKKTNNEGSRRRLDPLHHDSQRSGPTERPYTPELLSSMSDMLLNLIRKWGDRHLRLRVILEGYHKDVAAAYLSTTGNNNIAKSSSLGVIPPAEQPQNKNFHVILACPQDMDCSILSNVLVGLFEPEGAHVSYMEDSVQLLVKRSGTLVPIESSVLTTTNDMDLLALYKRIKPKFDEVYFVAPLIGRGELCEYDNVMCVNNDALVYTNANEMEDLVNKIAKRLRYHFFEDTAVISEAKQVVALNRLVAMGAQRADSSLGVAPPAEQPQNKNFHVILACPQDMDCSILSNVLVGLFEPEGAHVSRIEDSTQLLVKRSGTIVPIESSVLTTTNDMDLLTLYKRIKPKFDEVYFVAPLIGRGELCEYDNVMCVNNDAVVYSNPDEMEDLVSKIAKRLRYHFFEDPAIISESKQVVALNRLVAMQSRPSNKNFHVIVACPQDMDCSVVCNVLVGLFEPPEAYVSYMEDSVQLLVKRSGSIVPIESSVVTTTNDMDLLALYKRIKPKFDEVYFVAPMTGEKCEYDNVMCVNNDALVYSNPDEMEYVVNKIARRLRSHFFEDTTTITEWNQVVALNRLVDMEAHRADKQGEEKFGIRGGGVSTNDFSPPPTSTQGKAPLKINGKSYHIFQASPPHTASTVLNNFLIGMFEPNADYSFMVWDRERRVRRNDKDVSIDDGHIVTKTHILDLMGLYKQHRDQFDEVLFVVANRGVNPETRVDASLCQYNNVLCVEYEELLYSDEQGRETVVQELAQKLKGRFNYFFGEHLDLMDSNRLQNAVTRLQQMDQATISLADQPFTVSDNKFGVHGGHRNRDGSEMHGSAGKGKLFYCGGAKFGDRKEFKYSTFGLFLANSLFPEFEGKVQYQPGQTLINTAIPLTVESMTKATSKDILIMHSHQKCDVFSLEEFPGKQLHINAEYYDMHPLHVLNPNGEFTFDYLPPGDQSFVIGPHEDSQHSIRVPYVSMKLWYLHQTRPAERILTKMIDSNQKPKNTQENFLIYASSHYVEYRERAARVLSEIGTIHTAGKCQGNFEAHPPPKPDGSPEQCEPFEDGLRPPSILPMPGSFGRDKQGQNLNMFSTYRFSLVMENTAAPGYVSEKILDAFLAGSMPIYFGSRIVLDIFNPKTFIFFDPENPQQALSEIQYLEQNPIEYRKKLSEPIITNMEMFERYFSWDETVGNGSLKRRIRQMMGLQGDDPISASSNAHKEQSPTPQTPEAVDDSGALLTYSQFISRNMPLPQYSLQSVMNVADLFESRFALLRWDPSTDKFIGYYSKKQIWVSGCGKLVDSFKRTGKLLKMIFPDRFAPGNPELVMALYSGDYPDVPNYRECIVNNKSEPCDKSLSTSAPILAFSSVFSNPLFPNMIAMPMPGHHLPCFERYAEGKGICPLFQSKGAEFSWDQLTPQLVWRGTDFLFLPLQTRLVRPSFGEYVVDDPNIDQYEAVTENLKQNFLNFLPRWKGVVLTAESEIKARRTGTLPKVNIKFAATRGGGHAAIGADEYREWESIGFPVAGEKMSREELATFKYHIDIGGGGGTTWTGTTEKLAMPGLLFHHETATKDYIHDQLKPWVHYVPVNSDLTDVMEKLEWAESNPSEAKAIAENASELMKSLSTLEGFEPLFKQQLVDPLRTVIEAYNPMMLRNDDAWNDAFESLGGDKMFTPFMECIDQGCIPLEGAKDYDERYPDRKISIKIN